MDEEVKDVSRPVDQLDRGKFLIALERHIDSLAATPLSALPSPRVFAVDASWGHGKSWVARELAARLEGGGDEKRSVVQIDAFRYDHHGEPFAVIAAAITVALNPKGERRRKLLAAAGKVLQAVVPLAAKAGAHAVATLTGLDGDDLAKVGKGIRDATIEKSGVLSEKAVETLFASYSKTEKTQEEFVALLGALTDDLPKPLVVLIDELDRCRPSFALEFLERIKHLFSAENVVFVLFWNSKSIHESIRHTYGRETDADAYLSKFVAFTLPLDVPAGRSEAAPLEYRPFIETEIARVLPKSESTYNFRDELVAAAQVIAPSLRDLQKAIQLFVSIEAHKKDIWYSHYAYLLLVKAMSERRFRALSALDHEFVSREVKLFPAPNIHAGRGIMDVHAIFLWVLDQPRLENVLLNSQIPRPKEDALLIEATDAGKMLRVFKLSAQTISRSLTS